MPVRHFRYAGASAAVRAGDPAALDWLDEVLTPAFARLPAQPADLTLELRLDAGAHARREAVGPLSGSSRVPCFALGQGTATAVPWRGAPPGRVLFDPDCDVFYEIEPEPGLVRVVGRPGHPRARLPLLRILREIGLAAACRAPALVLRAAALVIDDRALVIAGPQGTGKTALLAHLLRQPGARFMSDDLVVVRRRAGALLAQGVPGLVTLRPDTPRLLPEAFRRLVHDMTAALLTPAERAALPAPTPTGDGSLILTPRQFADAAGVDATGSAVLVGIFLPEIRPDATGLSVHRLTPQEAAGRLTNSLFRIANGAAAQSVFAPFGGAGATYRSDLALLHRLIAEVPSFTCTLGSGAFLVDSDTGGLPVFTASGGNRFPDLPTR